jgi:Na+/melibiose symporter-like transporter
MTPALGLALAALRTLPALGRRPGGARSFDLGGALAVTAGLVLMTYAVAGSHHHGWGAAATLWPLAAGLALLALFALIEARIAAAPLVPPRIVHSRALLGANVVAVCLGGTAISMWFLVSLYVQQVLGFSPLRAGLTFLPMSVMIVACTQAASRLAARLGPGRVLAIGMTLLGTGMLLFSRSAHGGAWAPAVLAPSLLCASGIGCSFVCTTIAATAGVRREDSGLATGLVNTSFQIGGSVGLSVLATIAAGGFQRAFALGAGLAGVGAAAALAVLTVEPREAAHGDKPGVGAAPVALDCGRAGAARDRAQHDAHDDRVVCIAEHRYEVRDQVDR